MLWLALTDPTKAIDCGSDHLTNTERSWWRRFPWRHYAFLHAMIRLVYGLSASSTSSVLYAYFIVPVRGRDVAQLVEPRTRTPPSQVRFPGAARNISPRVNFQCRLYNGVRTPPCATACVNIRAHVKDPIVHVRVRWIMETIKHRRLGSATLLQLAFSGESNPNFPWEKSQWGIAVVKTK